ncbi:helix-turn-helix domain-containing protein [Saccharicrinis fermentans]|uniref:Chb operon repressor n=1 Tax=Saccharicrinis fermentans DSM 9555 = JCM 21142 TaxID=869213 RepID=W7Y3L7_9BACT|nr:AraC family transcriptional regulator [Saccharicrinis fermentans]GAF05465.1 chb operon repressor [Saccharicrinis fermentans DSM 9555 = JCM 21142]
MNNTCIQLCLDNFISSTEVFHLARTTITSAHDLRKHYHDYHEIFWVKEGHGFHLINGREIEIQPGSFWMIRPEDEHTFRMHPREKGLVITNIAFQNQELIRFKERYFSDSSSFFWAKSELPFYCTLEKNQLNDLTIVVDKFMVSERKYLQFDHIMLHIFEMLLIKGNVNNIPQWLSYALKVFNTPVHFNSGVAGFVSLTGKSSDHVNRVIKSCLNQTVTETINNIRLEFASRQLVYTNTPIKIISSECGFSSVSYFHRLFKSKFGITPLEYREKNYKVF